MDININTILPGKNVKIYYIDKNFMVIHEKQFEYYYFRDRALWELNLARNNVTDYKETVLNNVAETVKIFINVDRVKEVLDKSWLKDTVDYETFLQSVLLVELAVVKYGLKLDEEIKEWKGHFNSSLKIILREILLYECYKYKFCKDYPLYIPYIEIYSAIVTYMVVIRTENIEFDKTIQNYIQQTQNIIKYGVFDESIEDNKILSEILFLCLTSKRKNINDCFASAIIIGNLLRNSYPNPPGMSTNMVISSVTVEQKEETEEMFVKLGMPDMKAKYLNEIGIKEKTQKLSGSRGETNIVNINRSQFFLETIAKRKKEIQKLRDMFLKVLIKYTNVLCSDGDLNFKYQQKAYINSLNGDQEKDYYIRKKNSLAVDVVFVRDISGSTVGVQNEYAEVTIVILSALENIPGIRTAIIDFNETVFERKQFKNTIDLATIYPVSTGGTRIQPVYDKLMTYEFKGKRNLVIIYTDGKFDDLAKYEEIRKDAESTKEFETIIFGINTKEFNNNKAEMFNGMNIYKSVQVDKMPEELYNMFIRKGVPNNERK